MCSRMAGDLEALFYLENTPCNAVLASSTYNPTENLLGSRVSLRRIRIAMSPSWMLSIVRLSHSPRSVPSAFPRFGPFFREQVLYGRRCTASRLAYS